MKRNVYVFVGIVLLTIGVICMFVVQEFYYSQILIVLGIDFFGFGIVKILIQKNPTLKTLGMVILCFSFLNFLNHFDFLSNIDTLITSSKIESNVLKYLIKETIWLFVSGRILWEGVKLIQNKDVYYSDYIKTNSFRYLVIFVIFIMFVEIPIYGVHTGFFGLPHGHSIWNIGTHLH